MKTKTKKEKLFSRKINDGDALVNQGLWTNLYPLIMGFKEAAQRLYKSCETTGDRNTLVFPIVFNYRHYLELQLKMILNYLNHYVTSNVKTRIKNISKSHNLHDIWQKIKGLKKRLESDDENFIFNPKWDIDKVEQCISEFHNVDPESFAFRYITNKKGGPIIPDEIEYVNLESFINKMDEVAEILDDVDRNISIAIDYRLGD